MRTSNVRRAMNVVAIALLSMTANTGVGANDRAKADNIPGLAKGDSPVFAETKTGTVPARPQLEQVVIAFKTHFDIGYTDMAANVVERYRTTMIDQALRVVDQNRGLPREQQFAWTIPGWPMKKILDDWEGQTADRKRRILDAFKDGRFVVHALPCTTHTELLEPEDLVRGLGFASGLSRSAGLELPRDAKMTDVACHSWFVPTLLRHAGVDFLHMGCNAGCRSPEVPRLFWWEGPDGSRLLTMYTAESYGTGLVPPADWPHKSWLALIHTGDNHGPPTPEEVKKLLDEAKQKLPGVKIRIGRLSDFGDAILAEKPELPVIRSDMPDTWIHGPMCDPAGARTARNIRPMIAAAESLNSLLRLSGVKVADAAGTVAAAYENSLLYGEHTWGGALYWVTNYEAKDNFHYGDAWKRERAEGKFKRLEASWEEHTGYIRAARGIIEPVMRTDMQALADAVGADGPRIVVFNPLPWVRDGVVEATIGEGHAGPNAVQPVDGSEEPVAVRFDGVARFLARDVPAMGYRTYRLVAGGGKPSSIIVDEKAATIDNGRLRATLDQARGTVRSLVDKRTDRELIDQSAPHGFGQYLYERFDADQVRAFHKAYVKLDVPWTRNEIGKPCLPPADKAPYLAASPRGFQLRFERSSASVAAVMTAAAGGDLPHGVTTRLVFCADQPYADLEITLHQKPADPWPEAGWLCLPVKADAPQFRLGRLGSIIDPAKDVIAGSNRHIFALNTGMAILDGKRGSGVGLCPMDNPLVSLDVPGCWRYSRDFVPKRPLVYLNLFNNQWTTNFRMWNEGTWTSRVRIWAFDQYDAESSLATPAAEARQPLQAAFAKGPAGKLPATAAGVAVSQRGVVVTAFGRNPDGEDTVLRLWEQAGRSGDCEVQLPAGMTVKSAQPVDLRGRAVGGEVTVKEGKFVAPVRAFAPAAFVFQ